MFLLVPDADVEEFCFFNAEFKIPYQQFLIFLSFMSTFFKKLRSN